MSSPRFRVRVLLGQSLVALPSHESLSATTSAGLSADIRAQASRDAWYWPEADEVLSKLEHGIELALREPPEDDLEHAVALTKLAAELGRTLGARAYVWEATGLAHEAPAFEDQASDASLEDLPLYLWIAFSAREDEPGALSVMSRGMSTFERPEIEIDRSQRELEDILEVVTDAALYVLTASTALEDGETLEVTRGKVRVREMPSLRNDGTRALRLRLP